MSSTGLVLLTIPFATLPEAAIGAFLFVGAAVGHAVLVMASHNWWYGGAWTRRAVDALQLAHGLLLLAGPAALWWLSGFDPRTLFAPPWDAGRAVLAGYVSLCCLMGFGVLPALTLWRRFRSLPAVQLSNHTTTVDVAAELGYKPVGRGKFRLVARLPYNEVFQVDLIERTLKLPRLPRDWDGLTILHLSDFHLCGTPDRDYYRHVLDRCATWEPDIVAFTGDLVDTDVHYRWIVPLLGRLRWRLAAYAILGNHDYYFDPPQLRRRLGKLGMTVLGNGWTQAEVRGQPLVVIGHEGPWFLPVPDLSNCPEGPFRLCLSHTPDNIAWARRHGIDLMLSGHVHGGQVRLPLIGSVVVPSRYGRRYDCGTFHEPPTVLHVSRGLGAEQPLRYNCRPEVTRLVLRCAERSPAGKDQAVGV